jgi:hypothetical protein
MVLQQEGKEVRRKVLVVDTKDDSWTLGPPVEEKLNVEG